MKVLSLFSGIGAFEKALKNLSIGYELVNYCDIDKYASKSYSLIHNVSEDKNLGDITKVNTSTLPNDIDLITYGFPCQDISQAGKQKGFTDENGEHTRSGLFFEALRIIQDTKPKYAIAENVKALVGNKFKTEFNIVLDCLDKAGYNNYYKVLNAKDYGIPQNRERVFIVSIRKDIDDNSFVFPQPFELKTRLKDLLEDEVDEKYYLKDSLQFFINNSLEQEAKGNGFRFEPHVKENADLAKTITTRAGGRMDDNFILDNLQTNESKFTFNKNNVDTLLVDDTQGFGSEPRIYKEYSPTLRSSRQGLKIIQVCNLLTINGDYKGSWKNPDRGRVFSPSGLSPTITCMQGGGLEPKIITHRTMGNNEKIATYFCIRKLTPKECWRLMGFDDEDIDKCIADGLSNSQLYKQAGNSIVVNCIEEIYKRLFKE